MPALERVRDARAKLARIEVRLATSYENAVARIRQAERETDAGYEGLAAQSAGTSPPPSSLTRAPKRRSAGCGEILPATSDSP